MSLTTPSSSSSEAASSGTRTSRAAPAKRSSKAPIRKSAWQRWLGAVSYTHLRAHETSAHL
eukprot:2166488-Alexandrium_andersonii.AAC.1